MSHSTLVLTKRKKHKLTALGEFGLASVWTVHFAVISPSSLVKIVKSCLVFWTSTMKSPVRREAVLLFMDGKFFLKWCKPNFCVIVSLAAGLDFWYWCKTNLTLYFICYLKNLTLPKEVSKRIYLKSNGSQNHNLWRSSHDCRHAQHDVGRYIIGLQIINITFYYT